MEANPASDLVQVIVIDKDFTEHTLLNTPRKLIYLVFPDVHHQCNQSDCGLFALAFASSVCQNVDPVTTSYDQKCFHFHFLKCLDNNLFEPFPCSPKKQPLCDTLIKLFKVFCVCCLPGTGDRMIKCNLCCEWYHYTCVGLEEDEDIEDSWLCTDCESKEL